MSRPATLALIGPMGAGKSEVGRAVARLLGRKFRDTDKMVERKEGRSVAQIFKESGEPRFRALEREAVQQAVTTPGAVIACGGGLVLDEDNVRAIRSTGVVVYLKPTLDAAAARVRSGLGRPLIDRDDPKSSLAGLLQDREPLYRQAADHIVDADGSVPEVTHAVLRAIGKPEQEGKQANARTGP